jgi:hypothetical protein
MKANDSAAPQTIRASWRLPESVLHFGMKGGLFVHHHRPWKISAFAQE